MLAWGNALPALVGMGTLGVAAAARAICISLAVAGLWGALRAGAGRWAGAWSGGRLGGIGRCLWNSVVALALAAGVLEAWVVLLFGHRLRPPILFVVFETNPREAFEFVHMYANRWMALSLGLAAVPWLLAAAWRRMGAPGAGATRLATGIGGGLALVGAALLSAGMRDGDVPLRSFVQAFDQYRVETAAYYELKRSLGDGAGRGERPVGGPQPDEAFVLVLGESTGRNHLGIYGYPRQTTPRLSALGDRLLVFRDAISRQSHTQAAMKELLTFMNQESERPWFEYPTLLATLRQGGLRTYWVSNQEMYGLWANVTSALASQADARIFHKHREVRDTEGGLPLLRDTRDEELVPYVERILASGSDRPRLVVVHLMGTHGWYRNRFPPSFARFESSTLPARDRPWLDWQKARTIDDYDNAVLYNDHVLAELIARLEASGHPGWLLYLSDHGEEVYDTRDFLGHTEEVGTRHMIEVPLLLWGSEGWRKRYPERAGRAAGAVARPFMTDDLPHLVLDLAGVEAPAFDPGRSPLRPEYRDDRVRRYAGRHYDCELREMPAPGCAGR